MVGASAQIRAEQICNILNVRESMFRDKILLFLFFLCMLHACLMRAGHQQPNLDFSTVQGLNKNDTFQLPPKNERFKVEFKNIQKTKTYAQLLTVASSDRQESYNGKQHKLVYTYNQIAIWLGCYSSKEHNEESATIKTVGLQDEEKETLLKSCDTLVSEKHFPVLPFTKKCGEVFVRDIDNATERNVKQVKSGTYYADIQKYSRGGKDIWEMRGSHWQRKNIGFLIDTYEVTPCEASVTSERVNDNFGVQDHNLEARNIRVKTKKDHKRSYWFPWPNKYGVATALVGAWWLYDWFRDRK